MPGFDIHTLLSFDPPRYQCEKCLGLQDNDRGFPYRKRGDGETDYSEKYCPVCRVRYLPSGFKAYELGEYLASKNLELKWTNPVEQGRKLAAVADLFRRSADDYRRAVPLRALLLALARAEKFVHLCSFGMELVLLGALKLAAQKIPVRGVISGVANPTMLAELRGFKEEAPDLELKLFGAEKKWTEDMPHTKLVVIDGLLAFKGSANFVLSAWRKAAQGRELIEIVTDVAEVVALHNRYFSPVWAQLSEIGDTVTTDSIPF